MFGFLRSGKFNSAYSGLPGFSSGRNDELRYELLIYSVAIRKNISLGHPLFQSVCNPEGAVEGADTTDDTSATETAAHDFAKKNAALAEIFAKELTFLNRAIQMIALIASRYHQEQEDINWRYTFGCRGNDAGGFQTGDELGESECDEEDLELQQYSSGDDDDSCPSLRRSASSPSDASNEANMGCNNQLSNTLLIGSGQLMRSFIGLCDRVGLDICVVNAMTTADKPVSTTTLGNQRSAGYTCVLGLYTRFCTFQNSDRSEVVEYFQELHNISQAAWGTMSLFAFTNLYRLTKGTDFEMNPVNPDDAILSNRGRPFVAQMGKQACSSSFFETSFIGENSTSAAQEQSDDADAKNFTEEMKQMRNQFNTPEYVIDYGEQTPF
jgi:hypothetical protein